MRGITILPIKWGNCERRVRIQPCGRWVDIYCDLQYIHDEKSPTRKCVCVCVPQRISLPQTHVYSSRISQADQHEQRINQEFKSNQLYLFFTSKYETTNNFCV